MFIVVILGPLFRHSILSLYPWR